MDSPGLYGKLPMHGDFIQRNLPTAFVTEWDLWLQHFVAGCKEKIGEDWLDIYLTSPIWRFVFSHGVIDDNSWAGILMPSVDQVGRYYPFTIAMRLPDFVNPFEFIAVQTAWYSNIEDLALRALNGEFLLDDLVSELSNTTTDFTTSYSRRKRLKESYSMQIDFEFEEQSGSSIYSHFLDSIMMKLLSSYSAWSTIGSERIAPCFFNVQNLPVVSQLPAMIDGEWEKWGWQQPYVLDVE